MALRLKNVKTAEQISKSFVRGNYMKVLIVRKVLDSTPDTRGAHSRTSKKNTPRRTSGVESQTKMGDTCWYKMELSFTG